MSSRGLNLSLKWGEERTGDIGESGAVERAAGESELYTALVPAMEGKWILELRSDGNLVRQVGPIDLEIERNHCPCKILDRCR